MELINVSGIWKKQKEQLILKDISFSIPQFSMVAIAGETGSGKSSLFKIIGGLMQPDAGKVLFKNERVLGPDEKLLPGHPHIAYLSQHFELRNNYRVEEELDYTNHLTNEEAFRIYEVCDITHLLKRWTNEISGGEKQRIALARTLIASPDLLLLDEPFSNLDRTHKSSLKKVIKNISDELKITCMLITHDPLDSLSWAQEIIVLQNGTIVQQAPAEVIYHNPCNAYVASLFGSYDLLSSHLAQQLTGIAYNEKIFVRPEYLQLSKTDSNGLPVTITNINFYGSFYDVEVAHINERCSVRTFTNTFKKGDAAYLTFHPPRKNNLHSLPS